MKPHVSCNSLAPVASGFWLKAIVLSLVLGTLSAGTSFAAADPTDSSLADKSIEELMNIDVTSVSRKDQKLSRVPAAVFVITQEDIQRSGATMVPDVLRMAPGVQVQQIDSNRWAISVRGFSDSYSNKLLVLVDGRTIYTPAFSGVYWDQFDVPLDTIERIEVVRGPGSTVWGANAVNGVINIITKSAADTKGLRVTTAGGNTKTADYGVRFGSALGAASYRAYAGYSRFASLPGSFGFDGVDGWSAKRAGGRVDWKASRVDSFTLDGGTFADSGSQDLRTVGILQDQFRAKGAHGSASWRHTFSDTSNMSVSLYDTQYSRLDSGTRIDSNLLDLDFQHQFNVHGVHDIVWGGGYRTSTDVTAQAYLGSSPYLLTFDPSSLNRKLLNGFIQDEMRLASTLAFTVGTKIEHSSFRTADFEPSARLAWTPTDTQTVWLAASKATRLPADFETSFISNSTLAAAPGFQLVASLRGNQKMVPETLREYELGYRLLPASNISIDLTAFRGFYRDIASLDPQFPSFTIGQTGLTIDTPLMYGNSTHASTGGVEADLNWRVLPRWRFAGSYSWLDFDSSQPTRNSPAGQVQAQLLDDIGGPGTYSHYVSVIDQVAPARNPSAWSAPHHFNVSSYVDLTSKLTFDTSFYYSSPMDFLAIPSLKRLDTHVGWKVSRMVTAGISAQNLLTPRHFESYTTNLLSATQVPRSFFGKLEWNF